MGADRIVIDPTGAEPGRRIGGSFRDPSGYVFQKDGRLFRAIDGICHDTLADLMEDGLGPMMDEGWLVRSHLVQDQDLRAALAKEHPDAAAFLEHERVWPVTFPYEWSLSMLADAGLRTLDIHLRLLARGYGLKDATAYNIQFVDGSPCFIDFGSFERPARPDVWYALGQFHRMFTYPLLLCRYRGWDPRSYFLGSLGGRDADQLVRAFHGPGRWHPRLLLDVTLPAILGRRADAAGKPPGERRPERPGDPRAQILNLRRVRAKIAKLASGYLTGGVWAGYTSTCTYDDRAEESKKRLVRGFLESVRPARVLDLGANTGDYSFLAAACGARVVAVDQDHDAVELLYRRLRKEPAPITPLVIDLTNPSPAIGYCNEERPRFLDRAEADCLFALALLHHLIVGGNLSLPAVRDLLAALTRDYLVLEFVPVEDVQFQRLLRFRVNLTAGLSLHACKKEFEPRFELVREEPIEGSGRTLLFFRKRNR